MPAFNVKVRSQGKIKEVAINATNPLIAREQARRFGSVLSVSRAKGKRGGPLSPTDRYTFLIRLSTMLASKVGTTQALKLLRDSFKGPISNTAGGLLERVEMGVDLPTAVSEDLKNFPGSTAMIIKVGSQTGQAWRAFAEAAEFERKISSVRRASSRGLGGAILAFFFAGGLMLLSTKVLGPKIMKMSLVESAGDAVDIGFIDTIAAWSGALIIVMLVVLGGIFWLATIGRQIMPITAERIIKKIPIASDIVLAQNNYIALHRLSLLVRSGVRMEDSLLTSYESTQKGALKQDFQQALQAIKKGQKWAEGMSTLHPTDRAALLLASDRDQVALNLDNIAQQYQSLYLQRVAVISPIMRVAAALAVTLAGVVLFGQSVLPMLQVAPAFLPDH